MEASHSGYVHLGLDGALSALRLAQADRETTIWTFASLCGAGKTITGPSSEVTQPLLTTTWPSSHMAPQTQGGQNHMPGKQSFAQAVNSTDVCAGHQGIVWLRT